MSSNEETQTTENEGFLFSSDKENDATPETTGTEDEGFKQSAENLNKLSSGWTEGEGDEKVEKETIFSFVFDFLKDAGSWAEAVAKLIGLAN